MKNLRLRRLFKEDGKTLIVALDHGFALGPLRGIEDILETVKRVIEGKPDAVMLNYGVMKRSESIIAGKTSAVLSVEGGLTDYYPFIEYALRSGVDAVKIMVKTGGDDEANNIQSLIDIATLCDSWGIPLIAEMFPIGEKRSNVERIRHLARMAAEAGADCVKTFYTGDPKSFKSVVDSCPIPILILGGPRVENDLELLKMVYEALKVGASGVVFGRNIWQRDNPSLMIKALKMVIHEGKNPEEAAKILQ